MAQSIDALAFTVAFIPRDRSEVEERTFSADNSSPDQAVQDAIERIERQGGDVIEARAYDGEILYANSSRW